MIKLGDHPAAGAIPELEVSRDHPGSDDVGHEIKVGEHFERRRMRRCRAWTAIDGLLRLDEQDGVTAPCQCERANDTDTSTPITATSNSSIRVTK